LENERPGFTPGRCCFSIICYRSRRYMSQDSTLLHVYAWRQTVGPFFIGNPRTVDDGIQIAEDALKDRRRGFTRAEVRDVRALETLWTSAPAPVIRPRG
jgi:hypothetical protein